MDPHPLIALSQDRAVKQAAGFRQAAAELRGEGLAELYREEERNAPHRHQAGQKYLVGPRGRRRRGPRARRDQESLALALIAASRDGERGLDLSEAGTVHLLDQSVPLRTSGSAPEPGATTAEGADKRIGRIDLFGLTPSGRMVVFVLKYLPAAATRGSPGDTPLRALLEGLAACAMASANRDALATEVAEHYERTVGEEPPMLVLLGSARYWELCRKREAQKGAAWIAELERLGREIEASLGVPVLYLGIELPDPSWEEHDGQARLTTEPKLGPAWEPGAGRVKPKPRRKPAATPVDPIVEADPSRPPQPYALTGSYTPGDRIVHPTLGTGVVQAIAGPGKIRVLFDGTKRVLVHERPGPA